MSEREGYKKAGVDYSLLDTFKRYAQSRAALTAGNLEQFGFKEIRESRGETAYVVDIGPYYLAFNIEGLGTKNLITDNLGRPELYLKAGWDTAATIINDLCAMGASPVILGPHFAAGSSKWFENTQKGEELTKGWVMAVNACGAASGSGETSVLSGMVNPDTIILSGAGVGVIPQDRLISAENTKPGDKIILVQSSGIHANGLSIARDLAKELPDGYETRLPSGNTFGKALLRQTTIYKNFIQAVFDSGVHPNYIAHITGHGWTKLMRPKQSLTYRIHTTPGPWEEFEFIKKQAHLNDHEMYQIFNMRVGLALYVDSKDVSKVLSVAKDEQIMVWNGGIIEEGPKQVIIEPKGVVYKSDSLQIR